MKLIISPLIALAIVVLTIGTGSLLASVLVIEAAMPAAQTAPQPTAEIDTLRTYNNSSMMYTTSSVNVRYGPGTNYRILGELETHQAVEVTGETRDWYQTEYDGNTAYISKSVVTDTYEPVYAVINSTCNCRSGPDYDSAVIGEFQAGDRVEVLGGDGWTLVRGAGMEGYVGSRFLS